MTPPGLLTVDADRASVPGQRTDVAAWLLVQVAEGARAGVAAALGKLSGVRGWHETTGSYDFVVEIAVDEAGPLVALNAARALVGVGHVVCCRPAYGGDVVVLP